MQEANKTLHIENDRLSNEVTMLKHKLSELQATNTSVQQYKSEIDVLKQQVRIIYSHIHAQYSLSIKHIWLLGHTPLVF